MSQEEFDELISGPGYCKGCKKHVEKMGMVQFRGQGDDETDHIPGLIGYCYQCTIEIFAKKVH